MHASEIQTLYDYNCWANERILSAAAGVPAELFASARLGYCGLRDTLVHIFGAEQRWRLRWHTMAHMINHGTQHRSELALLLTELECSPGNIDLNVFVSERM